MAFGLVGDVSIVSAAMLMDGGSISITLQDSHSGTLGVFYRNNWMHHPSEYGGHFSLRFPRIGGSYLVRYRSQEEQSLLIILRAACIKTLGTADSEALGQRNRRDWSAQAMASLFRQEAKRPPRNERPKEDASK